ncbi:MAG: hypothetical protein Q9157_007483 [Trypethelium eluteriae]
MVLHLQAQNEILKHENSYLQQSLKQEKTRRYRNKKLPLLPGEDSNNLAQFLSPAKIKARQAAAANREQELETQRLQKEAQKVEQQQRKRLQEQLKHERKLERQQQRIQRSEQNTQKKQQRQEALEQRQATQQLRNEAKSHKKSLQASMGLFSAQTSEPNSHYIELSEAGGLRPSGRPSRTRRQPQRLLD